MAGCAFCGGGDERYHQSCLLRQALGGVGHLLDCAHWCLTMGDPDAGLTPYESGLVVKALLERLGAETVVAGSLLIPLDTARQWAGLEASPS